nr:ATP-dependent Clp protease proteolytic subunit [Astragalus macropelmatus]
MPIGLPKVPYLISGDEDASWIDLYNRLYYQRLLFLGEEINTEISNILVGVMVFLSVEDKTKDQFLFINSPGGKIISGMLIFDGMHLVPAEVQTVCLGIAASMAAIVLVGGEITKRLAFPHAKVMIHQPVSIFEDEETGECMLDMSEIDKAYKNLVQIFAQRTGRPSWLVNRDMQDRDFFMTAEQAQEYGIVDMVAESL